MTRILRLLLIAAVAWPICHPAAAQEAYSVDESDAQVKNMVNKPVSDNVLNVSTDVSEQQIPEFFKQETGIVAGLLKNKLFTATHSKNNSKNNVPNTKASAQTVVPPATANIEDWIISTDYYEANSSGGVDLTAYRSKVQVAFDGNDVYIGGLCPWLPNAWVKGVINGAKVTFESGQYFGVITQNSTNYEFYFSEYPSTDIIFTYNSANHRLTLDDGFNCFICADENANVYYSVHTNMVLTKPEEETVAEGSKSNEFVPVYGSFFDTEGTESQMIYPGTYFDGLKEGSQISSITFYVDGNNSQTVPTELSGATIIVYIGETSATSIASSTEMDNNRNSSTLVFQGNLPTGEPTMTIDFATPYIYNGGNIVIGTYVKTASGYKKTYWKGEERTAASWCYMYSSSYANYNRNKKEDFLPKMTIDYAYPLPTRMIDFGNVEVGQSKTIEANIDITSVEGVSASTNSPFAAGAAVVDGKSVKVPVTFTPTAANYYSDALTVDVNGSPIVISLKGIGNITGSPEAIRDDAFFEGISYNWTDSTGVSHISKLNEIATDPDQMIAMLKEIYTNKTIPGNFKRGYSAALGQEPYNDVYYSGVGEISLSGSVYNASSYSYKDSYGWDIPGNVVYKSVSDANYAFMDTTQYKPYNEGVTLLLVEVRDDFEKTGSTTYTTNTDGSVSYTTFSDDPYTNMRQFLIRSIKSVRVVSEAVRTGSGETAGTLFKIDADKLNKFYFIAKGQLNWAHCSRTAWGTSYNYCAPPFYEYYNSGRYYDYFSHPFLYHMFEQFSPVANDATSNLSDLYQEMVNMKSFKVEHDCMAVVPLRNHQFQMYGDVSNADDCQDVRDMMFFVPDFRMKYQIEREGTDPTKRKFLNYNTEHQPKIGLYVIRQDEVEKEEKTDTYYKLKLTWDSNMDEFLPGEQQEYQLYQVITDEFGVSSWVPVYKRNAQGQYWNPTTQAWQADTTGAEPVVLTLNPDDSKTYSEVYELREQSSRYVTYAIRGCDTGHFLSLQMSNEQSYLIEGLDPAEMAMLSSATVYSRFEAQEVRNCYSNKLQLKSSPQTIKASYLPDGSTMTINRTHRVMQNNQSVEVTEPVATLTINTSSKKFTVSGSVLDASVEELFPKGSQDGLVAGYHANNLTNNQIDYTTTTVNGTEYINFDIILWDNFVADVSNNDHPGLYIYQLRFNTAENFDGLHGSTNEAYSNYFPVFVYKTDSRINEPLTLAQVDGDTSCSDDYKPGDVEFDAHVMLSSKTEILRYDAYRWPAGEQRSIIIDGGATDADEEDADPNGIAGNQGGSYSVTMNAIGTADYYVGDPVSVTTAEPWNWATFVDYYPAKNPNALAYVYAPVVELFTRGYQEGSTNKERTDYNTYGGPLKEIALGKLHFNVMSPDATLNPLMSTYSWEVDGKKYAYYNIKLDIDKKNVPEGYQIYKVRAWRILDEGLQGEEYDELKNTQSPNCRVGEKVLFEDITYPDCDASENHQVLGGERKDVIVIGADHAQHTYTSYTGTFGARKLRTTEEAGDQSVISELPYKFIVRIYFTKQDNLQTTQNGASGQKAGNPVLNEDAKFYVAEYEFEDAFDSTNVPTAIQTLNAKQVVSEKYYNPAGIESDTPFQGVNIVVTRYSDGSTSTVKVLK